MTVDEAIELLTEKKRSLMRTELEALLRDFGFVVREHKAGHRSFTHPELGRAGFFGGDFDGGHGADAQVKMPYVLNVRKVFTKYRSELRAVRGEADD